MIHRAETDAQMVVSAIQNDLSRAPEGLIIQEIRSLLCWFNKAPCSYIPIKGNSVAHCIARLAFSNALSSVWLDNWRSIFWDVISSDL